MPSPTRRDWLVQSSAVLGVSLAQPLAAAMPAVAEPFGYCLNTATLMGQKLDLIEIVEIAAKAGYQAIEPWMYELENHVKKGGDLKALGTRLRDHGLSVESAIGFAEWIVDDPVQRKKGLEEVRRSMDLLQKIGGKRLAAPPAGATNRTNLGFAAMAERYRVLLDLGDQMGVVPELEFWGPSRVLSRLSEAVHVALEAGHPKACILPDVYHLYKGGSHFDGLRLLSGTAFHVIHFNDYPGEPARASITDAQRVYPGDGVAPLKTVLGILRQIDYRGFLSLELFNRDYWKLDAASVARTGLQKMRASVQKALA
jgi:sugar phosphate isomerase/epimerase